jgi:hypothetical protein
LLCSEGLKLLDYCHGVEWRRVGMLRAALRRRKRLVSPIKVFPLENQKNRFQSVR